MNSYSSIGGNLKSFLNEALNLYQSRKGYEQMNAIISGLREMESLIEAQYGFEIRNREILDIGSGQLLIQPRYFATQNRVTGIDLDVIAQGIRPGQYIQMLRLNGGKRAAKTIVRKLLGIDRAYLLALKKLLNIKKTPEVMLYRMDACQLTFPDNSFDFVHCSSVLHHLPDPEAALDGIVRILRPGGVVYVTIHLYTSETGCLDPRVFTDRFEEILHWPHLRLGCRNEIMPNAYVNELRLADWISLFEERMTGAKLIRSRSERPGIEEDARKLMADGELQGYDLEELLINHIKVMWQK